MIVTLVSVLMVAASHAGDFADMVQVQDLREEARLAKANDLVLLLEFSSEYCAYCRKLENLFLLPMQRNADYGSKILIRSVSLDEFETLVDFSGRSISTKEFAARYEVSLTPTLIFLNADGVELSDKLVGIWSEDYYGGFIDDRIDEAREKLQHVALAKFSN
ncbi:MAG: thioredoxin fold domain-containing protein [Gammaproteobacteria bacterium]|nr:thioredoxin fold domain-containing protein [Gammaproteobacteria bacterium]